MHARLSFSSVADTFLGVIESRNISCESVQHAATTVLFAECFCATQPTSCTSCTPSSILNGYYISNVIFFFIDFSFLFLIERENEASKKKHRSKIDVSF